MSALTGSPGSNSRSVSAPSNQSGTESAKTRTRNLSTNRRILFGRQSTSSCDELARLSEKVYSAVSPGRARHGHKRHGWPSPIPDHARMASLYRVLNPERARARGDRRMTYTDTGISNSAAAGTPTRIVVLGGGFGGVAATRELERLYGGTKTVEITLVSRDNFFMLTPLLFEACSGTLELRHCAQPIRPTLRRAHFVEATVEDVDTDRRVVHAVAAEGAEYRLPYDHLLVALGATTNQALIPGSEAAFTFKTMADALVLRNHLIERFERADVEDDPARRQRLLTIVVVGGGLVGVELLGELSAFADDVLRFYPRLHRDEVRFHLFEAGARILPEIDPALAATAEEMLRRRGADIRVATAVR